MLSTVANKHRHYSPRLVIGCNPIGVHFSPRSDRVSASPGRNTLDTILPGSSSAGALRNVGFARSTSVHFVSVFSFSFVFFHALFLAERRWRGGHAGCAHGCPPLETLSAVLRNDQGNSLCYCCLWLTRLPTALQETVEGSRTTGVCRRPDPSTVECGRPCANRNAQGQSTLVEPGEMKRRRTHPCSACTRDGPDSTRRELPSLYLAALALESRRGIAGSRNPANGCRLPMRHKEAERMQPQPYR